MGGNIHRAPGKQRMVSARSPCPVLARGRPLGHVRQQNPTHNSSNMAELKAGQSLTQPHSWPRFLCDGLDQGQHACEERILRDRSLLLKITSRKRGECPHPFLSGCLPFLNVLGLLFFSFFVYKKTTLSQGAEVFNSQLIIDASMAVIV